MVAVVVPAAFPPVAAMVPAIGERTITAKAKQTLFWPCFSPLPVSPAEFMWRKAEPGKHSAKTVTRDPEPRPLTLEAAPVVVVLFVLPDVVPVELPVPPVPPVVVAVAAGVGEAAAVAVPVAVVLELVLDELLEEPLELLLEPAVLLELALPPVLVMKPVEPQPHISVLARKRYVWGPLAVSSVRERPGE